MTWSYDLAGNIRRMQATYASLNGAGALTAGGGTEDYWYKYDAMNRFTTTMGTISGGVISHGATGSDITYNANGDRATMIDASSSEAYTYSTDGLVAQVSIGGTVRATYSYDTLGRVTDYAEKDAGGTTVYHRYSLSYANNGLLLGDSTATTRSGTTTTQVSTYSYVGQGTYNSTTHDWNYDGTYQGVTTRVQVATTVSGTTTNSETENWYFWADNALQSSTKYLANVTAYGTYNLSTFNYDLNNHLEQVQIADGHSRNVNFITDASGQVLRRDEVATGGSSPPSGYTPHELHYYFNGIQVGDVSNNGTSDTDYAASIAAHTATTSTGWLRAGQNYSSALNYGNFDQSYAPINGNSYGAAASSYTAADGDTLQSIAQMMWGDASLWYLIADANGMTSGSSIAGGTTLLIPDKVANVHNNATTFKPYDPNEAIGDVAPTVPKSKGNNCGVFGQILLVIIAIAVTLILKVPVTNLITSMFAAPLEVAGQIVAPTLLESVAGAAVAGAAGSIVSQGVGLATGIQNKFSWSAVAMAGISAGVATGLGGVSALSGADFGSSFLRGALGSAITQGIGVATGLQKKFDWTGVVAAGVGAGVSSAVGGWIGVGADGNTNFQNDLLGGVAGLAGGIADAATRTLINGTDFGDNIMAALPDIIGNTIGTLIANGIQGEYVDASGNDDDVQALGESMSQAEAGKVEMGGSGGRLTKASWTADVGSGAVHLTEYQIGIAVGILERAVKMGEDVSQLVGDLSPQGQLTALMEKLGVPIPDAMPNANHLIDSLTALSQSMANGTFHPGDAIIKALGDAMTTLTKDPLRSDTPFQDGRDVGHIYAEVLAVVVPGAEFLDAARLARILTSMRRIGALSADLIRAVRGVPRMIFSDGAVDAADFNRLNVPDPANGKLKPGEARAAAELEQKLGGILERLPVEEQADFIFKDGLYKGKKVDFMVTPNTAENAALLNKNFVKNMSDFRDTLVKHLKKADIVPIDTQVLTPTNNSLLLKMINELPGADRSRIILIKKGR